MKKTNNAKTCLGVLENEESEDADENADQRAADNVTDKVYAGDHSDDGDHRGDSQHDDADGWLDIQKSHRDDIGADSVRQIVLGRIPGATARNITEFEREYEDGYIQYEGTVSYNGKEYEFAIDGSTGNILEWEID